MATYNLTTSIPDTNVLKEGDILNCPYSGTYKMIKLPKGLYKLECWGAQSGGYYENNQKEGKNGGYSTGILNLRENIKLYLYSGGKGNSANNGYPSGGGYWARSGGYNGGGKGKQDSSHNVGGGGGGTDIRIASKSLYARVIVAGGGSKYGAATGGSTSKVTDITYFGQGKNSDDSSSGGGGGGWIGGKAGYGGSGYVYTSSTAIYYPSGCLLNLSYYLTNTQTNSGSEEIISPTGTTETGHTGNGYIRITIMETFSASYKKTANGWVKIYNEGITQLPDNLYIRPY